MFPSVQSSFALKTQYTLYTYTIFHDLWFDIITTQRVVCVVCNDSHKNHDKACSCEGNHLSFINQNIAIKILKVHFEVRYDRKYVKAMRISLPLDIDFEVARTLIYRENTGNSIV